MNLPPPTSLTINNSKNDLSTSDSCGNCPACLKAEKYIHPDIHFSFPVIPKKPGAPPPVSDDYMQEWREFISSSPYGNIYDWLQFLGAENKQGNITARECNEINHKLSLLLSTRSTKCFFVSSWPITFLNSIKND